MPLLLSEYHGGDLDDVEFDSAGDGDGDAHGRRVI